MCGVALDGSPAHAGIAPPSCARPAASRRLPRARGDRPQVLPRAQRRGEAPPRTRGSPRDGLGKRHPVAGSPAHAGIAPGRARPRAPGPRLPRARGDRPSTPYSSRPRKLAPPRTRGSPRHLPPVRHADAGSPAHAGIAPRRPGRSRRRARLPRARGDRPFSPSLTASQSSAPPRTRGSPQARHEVDGAEHGSPAHAGIAPWAREAPKRRRRLPRARGDRPLTRLAFPAGAWAPPRTRGSPSGSTGASPTGNGSPAHAGIAPGASAAPASRSRLPRARGDRPDERL